MKYSATPDELFILGMLHDIGYEFSETQSEHNTKGGLILKEQGYKFWKEVYYHGVPQTTYQSPELMLLNAVDMTIGPDGTELTMNERLDDIALRYGKGSVQYLEAIKLMEMLNKYSL